MENGKRSVAEMDVTKTTAGAIAFATEGGKPVQGLTNVYVRKGEGFDGATRVRVTVERLA